MNNDSGCREFAELVPELALGTSTGEERARSVEHLAGCASCRRLLDELSGLADDLLLLAPPHEPPIGFETRVLERIQASQHSPSRRHRIARRAAVLTAAAVLLVAATMGAVLRVTNEDRELGASYRRTLAVANGEYFSAQPLYKRSGEAGGHVFAYEGSPSWIFVVVSKPGVSGLFKVHLETNRGRRVALGNIRVAHGKASWGSVVPVDLHDIEEVTLSQPGAPEALEADL
jgi:Putative zinc-finger